MYGPPGCDAAPWLGVERRSYDARGNLSADGVTSYSYDLLNRLVTTGAGVTTVYDPEDRLLSLTQGATTTQFAYVGPNVATEFNASNQILRRYVPGPAEDEPVVWFEGSDGANPRWLLQDHQGSVVAVTDMTGGALAVNTYSDYGSPGAGNLGRYQFTGQVYLPEVGLYDYKARLYSPAQARFMQTDTVGYKDGLNWYEYVHDDPVNGTDPSGNGPEEKAPFEAEAAQIRATAMAQARVAGASAAEAKIAGDAAALRASGMTPEAAAYVARNGPGSEIPYVIEKVGDEIASIFQNGIAQASQLVKIAEGQGWTPSRTENGPLKYTDGNGVVRMTIKGGSTRAPGSGDSHVEIRDASGQRVSPQGTPVTRKSPDNHTPIHHDLPGE